MSCEGELTKELQARGYRVTPQRRVILHLLRQTNTHLTPTEVYEQVRDVLPGLTETTVYRTLEFLSQAGLAQAAFNGTSKRAYEISDHAHHHLLCRHCGKEIEIPHEKLDVLYAELEASTSFELAQNHITFFGVCPACQKN